MSDDGWMAAPAFRPEAALETLRRALRDLRLSERSSGFELRGKRVVELAVEGDTIAARLARRLMNTPEWDRVSVRSAADQRKLMDEVKKRLARWESEE